MKSIKPMLSPVQLQVLKELIELAGIGCSKETSLLNEHQNEIIKELQQLGYARVYKSHPKFMVRMKPRTDQI